MISSHTTKRFRKIFRELPSEIQEQAREAFKQFQSDPFYPSLHFKRVHSTEPIYSVRINIDYRAVGKQTGKEIIWFWIGSHDDYKKLLSRM